MRAEGPNAGSPDARRLTPTVLVGFDRRFASGSEAVGDSGPPQGAADDRQLVVGTGQNRLVGPGETFSRSFEQACHHALRFGLFVVVVGHDGEGAVGGG